MESLLNSSVNKQDFVSRLQTEFGNRKASNSRYSLRAFSRDLESDPSYLSKLFTRKRPFTEALEQHCSKKLGWPFNNIDNQTISRLRDTYMSLDLDSFALISEWHHYAIFELIKIKTKNWNEDTISNSLTISKAQTKEAIHRMERLGLIKRQGSSLVRTSKGITTLGNKFTTAAFRALQKENLSRAIIAMETIPIELRDQTSMTLAIPSSQITKAKQMLTKFRRRFVSEMQKKGELDSVYHLSLSFYPVSTRTNQRNKS